MRQCRRGHHVGRPRPDGAGTNHGPPSPQLLRIGDGGCGHRLLVMRPKGGKLVPGRVERLAETGNIPVAEDGPHAREIAHLCRRGIDELTGQIANRRLRRGASNRLHTATAVRALCHAFAKRENVAAIALTASASLIESANQARATFWKMVRPIAKPLTIPNGATLPKHATSSVSGCASPRSRTPRHSGSSCLIVSLMACQCAA